MDKPKNIENKHLYDSEEAKKRHTPPKNPNDNVPKDGIEGNAKNGINLSK
jgi:hypothetical protein